MTYALDNLVIQDPGTGSFVWTKVDVCQAEVDSGFGWIEEDTLMLVQDDHHLSPSPLRPAAPLPQWKRTRRYHFIERLAPTG